MRYFVRSKLLGSLVQKKTYGFIYQQFSNHNTYFDKGSRTTLLRLNLTRQKGVSRNYSLCNLMRLRRTESQQIYKDKEVLFEVLFSFIWKYIILNKRATFLNLLAICFFSLTRCFMETQLIRYIKVLIGLYKYLPQIVCFSKQFGQMYPVKLKICIFVK